VYRIGFGVSVSYRVKMLVTAMCKYANNFKNAVKF